MNSRYLLYRRLESFQRQRYGIRCHCVRDIYICSSRLLPAMLMVVRCSATIIECLDKQHAMACEKSSTKWLSVEAVTAKRLPRRLERKRDCSEIGRLARLAYRSACHYANGHINYRAEITCNLNVQPVLFWSLTALDGSHGITLIMGLLNSLPLLMISDLVNNLMSIIEQFRLIIVCKLCDTQFSQPLPSEPIYTCWPTTWHHTTCDVSKLLTQHTIQILNSRLYISTALLESFITYFLN